MAEYEDWLDKYAKANGLTDAPPPEIPPELKDAQNYYSALAQTPSALADKGAVDTSDLQAAANYYDQLGQTPLTPEVAKKLETEPTHSSIVRNAEADRANQEVAASVPGGKGQEYYSEGGAKSVMTQADKDYAAGLQQLRDQHLHDTENAKRMQSGRPTLEEEARNKLRAASLHVHDGQQANILDDASRAVEDVGGRAADAIADKAGKAIDAVGKGYHALVGENDVLPAGAGAGGMGAMGTLLPVPNMLQYASGAGAQNLPPAKVVPQGTPPVQILQGAGEGQTPEQIAAKQQGVHPDLVQGAGTQAGLANALAGGPGQTAATPNAPPANIYRANTEGTSGATAQPSAPLNIPTGHVVGGGWVRNVSPEVQQARGGFEQQRNEALAQNELDARLANQQYQQFFAQETARREAAQKDQQDQLTRQRIARDVAQETYDKAQKEAATAKIDPDKIFGSGGAQRVLATLGAALGAFGSAITKTPNYALEIINSRIKDSMDAQKAEIAAKKDTASNAYKRLLEATGDERLADNAFKQAGLSVVESKAQELGAGAKDAELMMGLRKAQTDISQDNMLYLQSTQQHQQGQVVGGITQKDVDRSRAIRDKAAADGKDITPEEGMRQALAERLVPQQGGYQSYAKQPTGAGMGRNLHGFMDYQQQVDRVNNAISQATEIRDMIKAGGKLSPTRTGQGQATAGLLAPELANALAGGTPTTSQIEDARKLIPEDPNSYQYTGKDQARIEKVIGLLQTRKAQIAKMGPHIAAGQGLEPSPTEEETAAEAGATEK